MTDKELLELAARANGLEFTYSDWTNCGYYTSYQGFKRFNFWNPLRDDSDAFCLAVELRINFMTYDKYAIAETSGQDGIRSLVWHDQCIGIYDSVRRAIVKSAAEIGKNL